MNVKITNRNIRPTASQLLLYKNNNAIRRSSIPNLRFGKVAFATDADVDG